MNNKYWVRSLPFTFLAKFNADWVNISVLSSLWLVMIILVNPIGNFPLNDDWAYGWTVKTLLETGRFELSDWTATNLLPQALWGTLFCLPFGFSFTALRFSTLTLGLLGIIAVYGLLREANANPKLSLFGTLVVAVNPIYFALSNTFHSDIPSFTFFIVSVYLLLRGIRLDSLSYLFAGYLLAFIAILNRQSSIIILPAFGIAYLTHKGLTFKTFIKAFSPTLVGIAIYFGYSYWLDRTERTPLLYGFQFEKLQETLSSGAKAIALTYGENAWLFTLYLGLFLFPFLILQFPLLLKTFSAQQQRRSLYFSLFFIIFGLILILQRQQMPLIGNILNEFSIGPNTLDGYNAFLQQNKNLRVLIRGCWALITLLSLVGASILIQYFLTTTKVIFNNPKDFHQKWLLIFILSTSFLYFLPIGGINKSYWFDRYLILILPLLMTSIFILTNYFAKTDQVNPKSIFFISIMLLFLGVFSVVGTHDYLLSNRVRWLALDNLMAHSQVRPDNIDGGFEFNGWYFGNRIERCNTEFQKTATKTRGSWEDFSCFWGNKPNSEYIVSLIPKPGYKEKATYLFRRWLPWRQESLYVLHKIK